MLLKHNKLDYRTVNSYRVIIFLNCIGKVYKKTVADVLAEWCEINNLLPEDKMRFKKE